MHAAVIISDSLKAKFTCGSAAYWAVTLSLVPLTGIVSLASALILVRNYNYKTRGGHDLPVGEVRRRHRPRVHVTCMTVIDLMQYCSQAGAARVPVNNVLHLRGPCPMLLTTGMPAIHAQLRTAGELGNTAPATSVDVCRAPHMTEALVPFTTAAHVNGYVSAAPSSPAASPFATCKCVRRWPGRLATSSSTPQSAAWQAWWPVCSVSAAA